MVETAIDQDRSWRTRVEAVTRRRLSVVAPTRVPGEPIELPAGHELELRWTTDLGQLVASGTFVALEHDTVAAWVVDVHHTSRRQRRGAFRLPVTISAVLTPHARPAEPVITRTSDLSELGVACVVPERDAAALGTLVAVTLAVPGTEPLTATARVVQRHPVPHVAGEVRLTRLGLELVDDDLDRRERLRRYVLEEQLARRRAEIVRTRPRSVTDDPAD